MLVLAHEGVLEALEQIDASLGTCSHRELISTDEVTDLLLDLRQMLVDDGKPLAGPGR